MTIRTAPRITGNGFLVQGYDVHTSLVARVDNNGEPCEVCQTEGYVIDCTVYGLAGDSFGPMTALFVTVDCCAVCVPAVIATMDASETVTVELSLASWNDAEDNGLMAHQDDDRPHPDAL